MQTYTSQLEPLSGSGVELLATDCSTVVCIKGPFVLRVLVKLDGVERIAFQIEAAHQLE